MFFHFVLFFTKKTIFMFLHFSQLGMGLYILHLKLKWISRSQVVNIHNLMMIYWTQKVQQFAHTRARPQTHKRKFRLSWKIGRKWLVHMRPHGGHIHGYTKCYAFEEFCVNPPWGLGASCKSMLKSSMRDHKKNNVPNLAVTSWESLHFSSNWFEFYDMSYICKHTWIARMRGFMFCMFSMHQNSSAQIIIQVIKKFVYLCHSSGWRDWS